VRAGAALAQPAPAPGQGDRKPEAMPKAGAPDRKPAAAGAVRPSLAPLKVSGRVLGPDGKPAPDADVVVMTCPWRYVHHGATTFRAGYQILPRGKTREDGAFSPAGPRDPWREPPQTA